MPTLLDQIVEVLDEVDSVADALEASGCGVTDDVINALDRAFKAMDRLAVTHYLFPPRSPDVQQLYRETVLEVVGVSRAVGARLDAQIARLKAELAA